MYHFMSNVNHMSADPITITPIISGKPLQMEQDTGSAASITSLSTLEKHANKGSYKMNATNIRLKTYSGEQIRPLGCVRVTVKINDQSEKLDLVVVAQDGPTLFGRDWLHKLRLNWREIKNVNVTSETTENKIKQLLDKHSEVFTNGIGKLQGTTGTISLQEGAQPKFIKARQVPYALRSKVEEELDNLQKDGVISPVEFSEWATPVVPIVRPTGKIRICGDYKTTLNPVMNVDQYPLPRIEDIFA